MILYVAPEAGGLEAAFVASRRVGGAVARNRARRVLRAAWRAVEPSIDKGVDVVFVARADIQGAKTPDVEAEMRVLLHRMGISRS